MDHFAGVSLNSPNDVVVASDGAIWFSDPAYGIELAGEGHPGVREYGDRWIFRFDESTGQIWPVVTDVIAPNGLAFSPDESVLYVCDSSNSGGEDGPGRHIRAYDVIDGRLAKWGRTIIEIDNEVPDGIKVDRDGRIWSSAGDGVRIFEPDGTEIGRILTPVRPDAVHVRDRQAAEHPDDHHGRNLGAPRLIASDADRRSEPASGPEILVPGCPNRSPAGSWVGLSATPADNPTQGRGG